MLSISELNTLRQDKRRLIDANKSIGSLSGSNVQGRIVSNETDGVLVRTQNGGLVKVDNPGLDFTEGSIQSVFFGAGGLAEAKGKNPKIESNPSNALPVVRYRIAEPAIDSPGKDGDIWIEQAEFDGTHITGIPFIWVQAVSRYVKLCCGQGGDTTIREACPPSDFTFGPGGDHPTPSEGQRFVDTFVAREYMYLGGNWVSMSPKNFDMNDPGFAAIPTKHFVKDDLLTYYNQSGCQFLARWTGTQWTGYHYAVADSCDSPPITGVVPDPQGCDPNISTCVGLPT